MKIVGYIPAKNEGDTIESICRHTATFCDEILLRYTKSSDNTLGIIEKLITEGLPIRLADRAQFIYEASSQNTTPDDVYTRWVFDSLEADWFIPVDSDEFLFNLGRGNPRSELETLSEDKYYTIPRKNYIYESRLNDNIKFLPAHFNKYVMAPSGKTLLSKYMWEKTGAKFGPGKHALIFPDDINYPVERTNLAFSHFPVRSREQFILQTTLNWLEIKNNPGSLDIGQHIRRMYEYIRSKEDITDGDLTQLSKTYGYPRLDIGIDEVIVDEVYDPLDEAMPFEKIELKYTDYSYYTKHENAYYNALADGFDTLIKEMRHNALKMDPGYDKAACIKQRGVDRDDWCGPDVEIEIATGEKGQIHIVGYYPNKITGKETGRIYVDGMRIQDFVVDEPLFHITVSTLKNAIIPLEIISDFSFPATAPDVRTLSFVLSDIYAK